MPAELPFLDRFDAGRILGEQLRTIFSHPDTIVLALPRGGVPVGFEVARVLHADFDIFLVRKLGVPGHEELAMGAIASGGVRVLNEDLIRSLGISQPLIDRVTAREQVEIERRESLYRQGRPEVHRSRIEDGRKRPARRHGNAPGVEGKIHRRGIGRW